MAKKAKTQDQIIQEAAKATGRMPYQIELNENGDITADSGGRKTVIGKWGHSDRD